MESRSHPNPYPKYYENESSDFFTIKDQDKIVLNENLEKKIAFTLNKLIKSIDKQYEVSEKFREDDTSVYVGRGGYAMFYYFYYVRTQNVKYLEKAQKLIEKSLKHLKRRRFSFLNGDAGPLALAAIIYETLKKPEKVELSIQMLINLLPSVVNLNSDVPDEILYGRAGYLYALLFVNSHLKCKIIEDKYIREVVESILKSGQNLSLKKSSRIPLEFEWHGKNYYGAAHGITGILYTLLKANTYLKQKERDLLIKPTLDALLEETFPSGNLKSSQGSSLDRLVQWCHGSAGFLSLLHVAHEVFKDNKYLDSAIQASENVWTFGLLRKGYSLCHGVAGNGYSFLSLYHMTHSNEFIYKALCFAEWCTEYNQHEDLVPDRPYSLYEGQAGLAFFLLDILKPTNARFPGYEDI